MKCIYLYETINDKIAIELNELMDESHSLEFTPIHVSEYNNININDGVSCIFVKDVYDINNLRGSSIATQLKSYMNVPIILLLSNEYKSTYRNDITSHWAFDLVILDGDNISVNTIESLVNGYKSLIASSNINDVLKLNYLHNVDYRFVDMLSDKLSSCSVNNTASFLLNEFININGELIDEYILSAKLGVDISKSGIHWTNFKELHLTTFEYDGVFSSSYKHWWSFKIDIWLNYLIDAISYDNVNSCDRVNIINKKFGTKLVPAIKTSKSSSSKFTTVCHATKHPIDSLEDGILIHTPRFAWQDDVYISIDELLSSEHRGISWDKVHINDRDIAEEIITKFNIS